MKTKGDDELLQEKQVPITLKEFTPPKYIKKIEEVEEAWKDSFIHPSMKS